VLDQTNREHDAPTRIAERESSAGPRAADEDLAPYRGIGTSMPTVARSEAIDAAWLSVELAGDQL
jgi:hypothetical protein